MKRLLLNLGSMGTVLFHFIACGLPLVFSAFGGYLSFSRHISPGAMTALMILAGAMLAAATTAYIKGCACEGKAKRVQKIAIIASWILYGTALIAHFTGPAGGAGNGGTTCH
ncbi:MAG: hypothetical protein LBT92_00350 [Rickettsiales bacterium]|jgi:hypothetical protein|nr:hypothetical protein [Rickettsiales bacterium]